MPETPINYPDIYKWGIKIASEESFTDDDFHVFAKDIISARVFDEGKIVALNSTILMKQRETIALRYFMSEQHSVASLAIRVNTKDIKAAVQSEYYLGKNRKVQFITRYEKESSDSITRATFPQIIPDTYVDSKERTKLAKTIWSFYLYMLYEEKNEIQRLYRRKNTKKGINLDFAEESIVIYPIPEKPVLN